MYNSNLEIIKTNEYIFNHKESFNREVGEKIKQIRKKNNLSVYELAERAITSGGYINQIENGKFGISLAKFVLICNSLNVSPVELLEEFICIGNENEDILFSNLQKDKDINKNILDYLKQKI